MSHQPSKRTKKASAFSELTKNEPKTAGPAVKIMIPPFAKTKTSDTAPSGSKGDDDEPMDDVPAFTWSNSDIPGTCVVFDCGETVPTNIPQPLIDLFCARAKMLYESPDDSHSVDLIETRICLQIGVFQLEDRARRNAMCYGYPEIDFEELVQRVLDMEVNINLLMTDATARLDCTVWEYLIDELVASHSTLQGLEKGKKISPEITKATRPG
jgi:hypothetical protein